MSTQSNETFTAITANGSSSAHVLPGLVSQVDVYLDDASVWDTATMILESSVDGSNWVAVSGASWTSGLGFVARVATVFGGQLRVTVSSVGVSTSLIPTVTAVAVSGAVAQNLTLTANGTTSVVLPRAGAFQLFVAGTWDSGSLTVDESPDGTLKVECVSAITADGGAYYVNTGDNSQLDIVLASVASAADLDLSLISV
jgi:hypothetical protein